MFPTAEAIHVLRSLTQRSITEFCSVPLHPSRISAHVLTTLRAIKRLKEKTKECSLTLTTTSRHAHLTLFAFPLLGYHAVAK